MRAAILLPVLLLLGAGIGAGAAWVLMPPPATAGGPPGADAEAAGAGSDPAADMAPGPGAGPAAEGAPAPAPAGLPVAAAIGTGAEYRRLDDPFLVPLVRHDAVAAMTVLSLGLELLPGRADLVGSHEPRLRNQLLQALFDHANTGGFDGMFTGAANMRNLRESLTRAARDVLGDAVGSVLILDMVRQEG